MKYVVAPLGALGLVLLAGCSDSVGQLNQSPLVRDCAPEDTACQRQVAFAPLAAGAEMVLTLRPDLAGTTGPAFQLEPVDTEVLDVRQNKVVGLREGVTAVLARSPDGVVVEFVHVWVEKADYLSLHLVRDGVVDARDLEGRVQLLPGEELRFTFRPWSGTRELIGDPGESWFLEGDPGIALVDSGVSGERRVVITDDESARATLHLEALGLERTLELEVIR